MGKINHKFKKGLAIMAVMLILIISISAFSLNKVHDHVRVEVGTENISLALFTRRDHKNSSFITDVKAIDVHKIGDYQIELLINDRTYTSTLHIEDTIAPEAILIEPVITYGEDLKAEDFVSEIIDASHVEITYEQEPNFDLVGQQVVNLLLTDEANNKSSLKATMSIDKVYKEVFVEAGTKDLDISDFMRHKEIKGEFITDINSLNLNKLGRFQVLIQSGEDVCTSTVDVIDTIKPKADVVHQRVWLNEAVEASNFVENIVDSTEVMVAYEHKPDFNKLGEQRVNLLLRDSGGNLEKLTASFEVCEDLEAPKFSGIHDQTVYLGQTISYRKDVSVNDNKDEKVTFTIDNSQVDLTQVGQYKVHYKAEDEAGNQASNSAVITVQEKPKDFYTEGELHEMADSVLESIIRDDMSDKDKLWAIFTWTKGRIKYTANPTKEDWTQEAVKGIKTGSGDCVTYYATAEELLTRAGFENMMVTRNTTTHYWNLVKYNDQWYHFDTCWHFNEYPYVCFLRTDAEVIAYSEWCKDYYSFDAESYPATPTELLLLEERK